MDRNLRHCNRSPASFRSTAQEELRDLFYSSQKNLRRVKKIAQFFLRDEAREIDSAVDFAGFVSQEELRDLFYSSQIFLRRVKKIAQFFLRCRSEARGRAIAVSQVAVHRRL